MRALHLQDVACETDRCCRYCATWHTTHCFSTLTRPRRRGGQVLATRSCRWHACHRICRWWAHVPGHVDCQAIVHIDPLHFKSTHKRCHAVDDRAAGGAHARPCPACACDTHRRRHCIEPATVVVPAYSTLYTRKSFTLKFSLFSPHHM